MKPVRPPHYRTGVVIHLQLTVAFIKLVHVVAGVYLYAVPFALCTLTPILTSHQLGIRPELRL
jgi:hypothetical protein